MKRREFVAALGAAAAWPFTGRAQQPAIPVIGFVRSTPRASFDNLVVAFRQGLKEAGLVEGQSVKIEYRYADNQIDRLPALVADLLMVPVAVIAGDNVAALAAKAATTTVPIVVLTAGDPVRSGLVASLNRPGGNVTGVSFFAGALGTKRLELLRQLTPNAKPIAVLMNPDTPTTEEERADVQAAAQAIGQQLVILTAASDHDIEIAFTKIVEHGAGALLVAASAFLNSRRASIVALATRHGLPAVYPQREFVTAGSLMSYGTSISDAYRQGGLYAARIVNGEKPADLPVMQPTRFELVINLAAAKALGLDVPNTLLALADEVIE